MKILRGVSILVVVLFLSSCKQSFLSSKYNHLDKIERTSTNAVEKKTVASRPLIKKDSVNRGKEIAEKQILQDTANEWTASNEKEIQIYLTSKIKPLKIISSTTAPYSIKKKYTLFKCKKEETEEEEEEEKTKEEKDKNEKRRFLFILFTLLPAIVASIILFIMGYAALEVFCLAIVLGILLIPIIIFHCSKWRNPNIFKIVSSFAFMILLALAFFAILPLLKDLAGYIFFGILLGS